MFSTTIIFTKTQKTHSKKQKQKKNKLNPAVTDPRIRDNYGKKKTEQILREQKHMKMLTNLHKIYSE